MKDKVARWLKAGALLLTVVALSAALVACQGAVGPTGPSGADGTDGTDGTQGPKGDTGEPGDPGISALVALDSANTEPKYVDNDDKGEIGALPIIDVSKQFRGGKEPVTYKITKSPPEKSTFKVMLTDNVLTVEVRSSTVFEAKSDDYTLPAKVGEEGDRTLFTVAATDADNFIVTKKFAVLANRKPTVPGEDKLWTLPDIGGNTAIVGTQSVEDSARDGGAKDTRTDAAAKKAFYCETFDTCVLVPDVGTSGNPEDFGDDDYGEDNKLTYSVIPGRTSTSATVTVVGGEEITITGLKSTWKPGEKKDGKLGKGSHVPVVVTIRATDDGGLSVERDLRISVDGQPTKKASLITSKTIDTDDQVIVNKIAEFFVDPEMDTLTFTASSSNPEVATATVIGNLKIDAKNPGNVVVTVKASDPLGQSVSHEIAVTIN